MASITVRDKNALKLALDQKYDIINIKGELTDEISKMVDKNSSKSNIGKGATAMGVIGGIIYHGINLPMALVFDVVTLSGIFSSATAHKMKKYDLRMTRGGDYYLKRK